SRRKPIATPRPQNRPPDAAWTRFHPLYTFCDHDAQDTGEALVIMRPGNAGSNTPPTASK
ncbi:hypothetical protein, partial [Brooklawnia sp.]|uniref:hypothetical protein n=1 Tax=Brooklawnia sp. TaxID=2699740 RepID=UPI00311EFBBB